jgi:hypothetical protein
MLAATPILAANGKVTTPQEQFGFEIGADYQLLTYTQLVEYWKKLETESDRMKLVEYGTTAEGRTMYLAIITSPQNHQNLDRYKEIAGKLALAEGLTDDQAHELAAEGKAVVWIDGGLHATEIVNAQAEFELVYQMLSRDDPETTRFLNDVILLTSITNPDGMELVSNWYMRESDPKKRSTSGIPRLYQKYVGHDNNRDSFMANMPETEAMNQMMYREWFPQIVYNRHQTGPTGTILFCAPFRDTPSYNMDPLMILSIEMVGNAMHRRFVAEGKPGSTMRSGASYSTWWNGCVRCTPYFHNMIGILTEIIGNPTPMNIPFRPQLLLPKNDYPYPIMPRETWHFRESIDYIMTADRAIMDLASKNREDFLYNIYLMGRNSIERGSRDHWTLHPKAIEAVEKVIEKDGAEMTGPTSRYTGYPLKYYEMLHKPEDRDPRGFILPSDQADFLTATKFMNALIKAGITVHRATEAFDVAGKTYPAGSYVVKTAQAFRPHVMDMFEPQDHPDDIPYPGGPPKPPYDNAGYTLAYAMGVEFDRILDGFDGPFEKIDDVLAPPKGQISGKGGSGFLLSHEVNDAFVAINRLVAAGEEVYWMPNAFTIKGKNYPAGTIYIRKKGSTTAVLQKLADEKGLTFEASSKPRGEAMRLKPVRIGLWDQYGGSMPSGWVRWMLEQYEFPFEVVYPKALDEENLNEKFDVLVFVGGAIPGDTPGRRQQIPDNVPAEYQHTLGKVTVEKTVPRLKQFLEAGGSIITIGSSTSLGYHLDLPIANALVETTQDGKVQPLPPEKYFIPGSIVQVKVDNTMPIAHGLPEDLKVMFNKSPVFRIQPDAPKKGVHPIAWFPNANPLLSGWAWGEHYLDGGVSILEAEVGKGKLFLFGPEITNRAQTHGTFKFLFNGFYYPTATKQKL